MDGKGKQHVFQKIKKSMAWESLNLESRQLFIEFCAWFIGEETVFPLNSQLLKTGSLYQWKYRQYARIHIKNLINAGLIECVDSGFPSGKAAMYRYSWKWYEQERESQQDKNRGKISSILYRENVKQLTGRQKGIYMYMLCAEEGSQDGKFMFSLKDAQNAGFYAEYTTEEARRCAFSRDIKAPIEADCIVKVGKINGNNIYSINQKESNDDVSLFEH